MVHSKVNYRNGLSCFQILSLGVPQASGAEFRVCVSAEALCLAQCWAPACSTIAAPRDGLGWLGLELCICVALLAALLWAYLAH